MAEVAVEEWGATGRDDNDDGDGGDVEVSW